MARNKPSLVYIGIQAHVVAFDRKSGVEVWRTELSPKDKSAASFVNVVRDRDGLFASCAGELFALDPATGTALWHDPLKGLGTGLVTIATDLGGTTSTAVVEESARQTRAAASAAAAS
jgi:outer membrane protein assembly factor BamB